MGCIVSYNLTMLSVVAKLEYLPENNKKRISGVNGKGCINKSMISAITRRIITKTMIDEDECRYLPKKTNESKQVNLVILAYFVSYKIHGKSLFYP